MSSAANVGIYVQPKTGDVSVTGNIYPSACNVYDLGSAERRWKDLYLSGNTIDLGGTKISRDAIGGGITIASETGGTVDSRVKNLFADGTITASNLNIVGDYVTMRTTTSNTEMMVIENAGTGPALKVTQTGVNSIAEFYDDGGVLALKIADGGNVGIGTSAPLQKLHVQGGCILENAGTGPALKVTQTGVNSIAEFYDDGGVLALKIADGGNVGIGTSTPLQKLHVVGAIRATTSINSDTQFLGQGTDSAAAPSFSFVTNTNTGIYKPVADSVGISCGGTERLRVLSNGNVGIGTTNPLAPLHVQSTGAMIIPVGTDAQLPATSVVGMLRYNLTSNRLQFYNGSVWNLIGGVIANGGTVNEITGYRVHTFTSSGTFTVQSGGEVEYLIVAGGGGGGFPYGGGGGAGGIVYASSQYLVSGAHNVVIGAGGLSPYSSGSPYASIGGKGNNSSLIAVIAEGGGGGSGFSADSAPPGASGGCGGGGSPYNSIVGGSAGGTGSQGGSGGAGRGGGPYAAGGGGGAAPTNGTGGTTTNGGNGGNGFLSSLNGQIYVGGGGGGGIGHNTGSGYVAGSGGQGGGGTGSALAVNATSGTINTGGGGGGGGGVGAGSAGGGASGNGGSGIVIIRYRV